MGRGGVVGRGAWRWTRCKSAEQHQHRGSHPRGTDYRARRTRTRGSRTIRHGRWRPSAAASLPRVSVDDPEARGYLAAKGAYPFDPRVIGLVSLYRDGHGGHIPASRISVRHVAHRSAGSEALIAASFAWISAPKYACGFDGVTCSRLSRAAMATLAAAKASRSERAPDSASR